MNYYIRNGRIIDPANGIDQLSDLVIADGRILSLDSIPENLQIDREIDARNQIVCPGLIDLQARLREPGQEHKGTLSSETRAAASAGITTLCCPPDTNPVIDTEAVTELIRHRAQTAGHARVLPLGALTVGLAGEHLSEMQALRAAGCIAVSNARHAITNTLVMRRALEYAATLDLTVMLYAQDPWLVNDGCVHEGALSTRLGLSGIPESAETVALSRDLMLIEQTGVRAHFGQLSSARAVEMIAKAQAKGLPVSADVSAHQLYLTEMDVGDFNSQCHLLPPLRTQRDQDALRAALSRGILSAIVSDHQPHDADAKLAPFAATEPGMSGLETMLPLALRLVDEKVCTLIDAIALLSSQPAAVLGIEGGNLSIGARADICIFDPEKYWTVTKDSLLSHGKNTPFMNWELKGKVTHTFLNGKLVYEDK
ncbi:MAG: dihydroorotase [Gammaproteobacteria bacterium]|nr:dihydroorotase [Gammaproteobacteria bacterium]